LLTGALTRTHARTANLPVDECREVAELPVGVYYGWAFVPSRDTVPRKAAVSIGWNPFYKNTHKTLVRTPARLITTTTGFPPLLLLGRVLCAVCRTAMCSRRGQVSPPRVMAATG
jgi:hypothetical protein